MAPDIGVRIATMLRALEEVILPAIDPEHKPAIQQVRLCILNLQMIAAQHDKAYHLAITELHMFAALMLRLHETARSIVEPDLCAHLDSAVADEMNNLRTPAFGRIEAATQRYRELADAILESPRLKANAVARQHVIEAVMAHSAEEAIMRRAWSALAGMESDPDALPSLDTIIASAISNTQGE